MADNTNYEQALKAAEELAQQSQDAMYEELGLRIQDMQNAGGYARSQEFSADFRQDADDLLGTEDLKNIGRKWLTKFEKEMVDMICVGDNKDVGTITGGKTIAEFAAGMAVSGLLISLAPPAWLIAAATIIATKLMQTGLDSFCEYAKAQPSDAATT